MKKLKEIQYFSKDKMYNIKEDVVKNHPKSLCILMFAVSCLFLLISALAFTNSFNFDKTVEKAEYSINGNSDFTVYLKDNDYYPDDFLPSGMQYVASLINTVNTSFNYEVHADKDLDLKYSYKVLGTLKVYDKDKSDKVLYTKVYDLTKEKTESIVANNIVINEKVDIDYDLYNSYVNSYISQYGLLANSELEVALVLTIDGEFDHSEQTIANGKVMTINIPLSEQTLDIDIKNSTIQSSEKIFDASNYSVSNIGLFLLSAIFLVISLFLVIISTRLAKKYVKENIYTITLGRILKEYDRIIVNASFTLDENEFANKIYVDSFTELVDASQSFNEPILFYNVIPGEKCFFVIIKGDTLYKMRLTKAYLENEKYAKENKSEAIKNDNVDSKKKKKIKE